MEGGVKRLYPKDTLQNREERRSYQILNGLLDTCVWDFKGKENHDHGVDYMYEYIENGEYKGYRILAQIKGRRNIEIKDSIIVFDFPVKTANYAVGCSEPFIFFLVDLSNTIAYYLSIQDFFIANEDKMQKLAVNKSTIRLVIPCKNIVDNEELRVITKSQYCFDDSGLRKTR